MTQKDTMKQIQRYRKKEGRGGGRETEVEKGDRWIQREKHRDKEKQTDCERELRRERMTKIADMRQRYLEMQRNRQRKR